MTFREVESKILPPEAAAEFHVPPGDGTLLHFAIAAQDDEQVNARLTANISQLGIYLSSLALEEEQQIVADILDALAEGLTVSAALREGVEVNFYGNEWSRLETP